MRPTLHRIVAVNAGPAIGDMLASASARKHTEIVYVTSEADLRARLSDRVDVLVLGFDPDGLPPVGVLRMVGSAQCRPSIVVAGSIDDRIRRSLRRLVSKLRLDAIVHVPTLAEAAAAIENLLRATRSSIPAAADLRRALDEHDLTLIYQPKLACGDDRVVVGVEAFVRWNHPELGELLPNRFLPLAESSGLLTDVTDFTLTEAIYQQSIWRDRGLDLPIAVNLAPGLIKDSGFPGRLLNSLRQFDVAPHRLTLELKETDSVTDRDLCVTVLASLRRAGVRLALDDYGTGLSSITELYKLPFTEVKIDRDLVVDATNNTDARVVLRSIVRMAHDLHIDVTAEGVETRSELASVAAAGCDSIQGNLLCEPQRPLGLEQFLSDKRTCCQSTQPIGRTNGARAAAR